MTQSFLDAAGPHPASYMTPIHSAMFFFFFLDQQQIPSQPPY